jgi:ribosomal protein L7Ae-like RNA K-turn-binding protein
LARRCCDALGLARRAGLAVAGFDRASEAVRRGRAALLLFAVDGAESGRRKLGATAGDLPSASVLTAAELGGAFGHERIVHAAVGGGTLCDRLRTDLARLAGFRVDAAIDWD